MSSKINLQTCEYARKSSIFQDNQLIFYKSIEEIQICSFFRQTGQTAREKGDTENWAEKQETDQFVRCAQKQDQIAETIRFEDCFAQKIKKISALTARFVKNMLDFRVKNMV